MVPFVSPFPNPSRQKFLFPKVGHRNCQLPLTFCLGDGQREITCPTLSKGALKAMSQQWSCPSTLEEEDLYVRPRRI